jgi:hypothetical protein
VLWVRIRIGFGRFDPVGQKLSTNVEKSEGRGGGFYFSCHQKKSKFGTLLQTNANEAEMKEKVKKF